MSQWISVKDKMPPTGEPVLVFGPCCEICNHCEIAEHVDGRWASVWDGDYLNFAVSYWMPIPPPPLIM